MLRKVRTKIIPYNTAFVVNPIAGDGKAGRIWPKLEEMLQQSGQSYRVYFTRNAGDGTGLAARASDQGAELVVAVGGDGTLKEVLNGIDLERNIFGMIPAGTGNGFIRSLSIPLKWEKAFQGLARWEPRRIDIGRANNVLFLNSAGVGLDGAVASAASAKYKSLKGYLAYAFALVDQAVAFNRFQCKVKCNGLYFEDHRSLVVLVANGRYYGGKLCIAPQASLDDGYLDLVLIKKRSIPDLLVTGARVAVRKHLSSKAIIKMQGQTFDIETSREVPLQIDGDVISTASVKVETLSSALKVLAPAIRQVT